MKKLKKVDGVWALQQDILSFTFDGMVGNKTLLLEAPKWEFLLHMLHKWIRSVLCSGALVPFAEFESVIAKLRHALIAIPAGAGLLSCCNHILGKRPRMVSMQRNKNLLGAIRNCRTIL
jgi:hypothetical protein